MLRASTLVRSAVRLPTSLAVAEASVVAAPAAMSVVVAGTPVSLWSRYYSTQTPPASYSSSSSSSSSYDSSSSSSYSSSSSSSSSDGSAEEDEYYPELPEVGKQAPLFSGTAAVGSSLEDFSLKETIEDNAYTILFFYPLDFTFVCPTELIALSNAMPKFAERSTSVVGISVDSQYTHLAWNATPRNRGGVGNLEFPLFADLKKEVSSLYGVLNEKTGYAHRGTFILDNTGKILYKSVIADNVGRSVPELLRLVDAFQLSARTGDVCPANWKAGAKTMTASPEGIKEYYKRPTATKADSESEKEGKAPAKKGGAAAKKAPAKKAAKAETQDDEDDEGEADAEAGKLEVKSKGKAPKRV